MKKNYIYIILFNLVLSAFTVGRSEPDDEVTTGIFDRLFSPISVEAVVQKKTDVKFKQTTVTNVTSYAIELYENQDTTLEDTPKTHKGITDNIYTVGGLLGETQYVTRIRALSEGINESKQSAISLMAEAGNILSSAKDENIEAHAVTLTRDAISATVTKTVLSVDGKTDMTYTLESTGIANKKTYIDELEESTSYTTKLCNVDKLCDTVIFKTAIDLQGKAPVYEGDNLATVLEEAADGANIVLVSGSFILGDYALSKSVITSGYDKVSMLTIYGRLQVEASASSIEINNVIFRGDAPGVGELVSNFIKLQGGTNTSTLTISGCEVRNYKNQILYCNVMATLGTALFENCQTDDIIDSDGDDFNPQASMTLGTLIVQNSTLSSGIHTFLRHNMASTTVSVTSCTFYKVCSYGGDSNNSGLFLVDKVSTSTGKLAVEKCVLSRISVGTLGYWAKKGKMKTQASYSKNYCRSSVNLWDTTNGFYIDPSARNATEIDPKFTNPESGDFTVGAEDIKDSKAGGPRWIKE